MAKAFFFICVDINGLRAKAKLYNRADNQKFRYWKKKKLFGLSHEVKEYTKKTNTHNIVKFGLGYGALMNNMFLSGDTPCCKSVTKKLFKIKD